MRTCVLAFVLCCALAAAHASEVERPKNKLDSLAASMLPERDEAHDSYLQKLFSAPAPAPGAAELLFPDQEMPNARALSSNTKSSHSSVTKPHKSTTAAAPSASVTKQSVPTATATAPVVKQSTAGPVRAGGLAFPAKDMTLDENFEEGDLPQMNTKPVSKSAFVEMNARHQRRHKKKWVSCANDCGGEHTVVKALKAGRKTPRCCVDLLYETTMYVHRLLSRNGITYWAMKGTLLGVVREQGIIPHDYDIDIGMLHRDINKVASLRRQVEKDGYVMLRAPWTGYNNMNFVILKRTKAVRDYFDRNPVNQGERPVFTKELRKLAIAAELMVFKKMRGHLVQVLCTEPHPRNPDLYVGTINPSAYEEFKMDLEDFQARKAEEKDGWLKYANQNDKPWVNYFKKFTNNQSPFCEHTAPASFRYDVPARWVLPPRKMRYYSKKIFVPAHSHKYASHYFGKDYMTPKRRYGDL